jgi:hypothetical protein
LLFFAAKPAEFLAALPDNCVLFDHATPLSDCLVAQDVNSQMANSVPHLYEKIGYLASKNGNAVLSHYDWLLTVDVASFVTPKFSQWFPATFQFATMTYAVQQETREQVVRWARVLGLRHRGLCDVSLTWYGPSEQVRAVARLVAQHGNEFYRRAFVGDDRLAGWPVFHRGAALLYLVEMAVNHVAPEAAPTALLERASHRAASIIDSVHIRCFATSAFFSSHSFRLGLYSKLNSTNWPSTDVRVYSLEMVLFALLLLTSDFILTASSML